MLHLPEGNIPSNLSSGRILAELFPIPEAIAWLLFTFKAQGKSYFYRPKIIHVREMVLKNHTSAGGSKVKWGVGRRQVK